MEWRMFMDYLWISMGGIAFFGAVQIANMGADDNGATASIIGLAMAITILAIQLITAVSIQYKYLKI